MCIRDRFPQIPNLLASCDLAIEWGISTTALEPINSDKVVVLYPNPTYDVSSLYIPPGQGGKLFIVNAIGEIYHTQEVSNAEQTLTLDSSSWPKGTYNVSLVSKEGLVSARLIVL